MAGREIDLHRPCFLDSLDIVQTQPSNPTFQLPPKRSPSSAGSGNHRIYPWWAKLHPVIIRPRSLPDIQVTDLHPYQKRHFHRRLRCLRFIHHIPVSIKYLISRILICTLLCVGQNLISALLRLAVSPCLADAVPPDSLLASGIGRGTQSPRVNVRLCPSISKCLFPTQVL